MTTEPELVRVRREARADRRARARVRIAVALATGVAGAICVAWAASGWSGDPADGGVPAATAAPSTASQHAVPTSPQRPLPTGRAARPVSISVPALDVEAPVLPMSAIDGVLTPPPDASTVGWWDAGARPGAKHGTVVIAGHTVHAGDGAFDHLGTVAPGDRVTVRTRHGVFSYAVRRIETYDRATLAAKSSTLFGQDGPARMLLITCEDWDGQGYRSNTVVYARPLPSTRERPSSAP